MNTVLRKLRGWWNMTTQASFCPFWGKRGYRSASSRRIATASSLHSSNVPARRLPIIWFRIAVWRLKWHIRRYLLRPRLAAVTLALVWGAVCCLAILHLMHATIWPAQAAQATTAKPPVLSTARAATALLLAQDERQQVVPRFHNPVCKASYRREADLMLRFLSE